MRINSFLKKIRVDTIVRAILLIILGILFLINPKDAILSSSILIASFIICDGVMSLAIYFLTSGLSGFFGTTLIGSIFKILIGIFAILNPDLSSLLFSVMFAVYLIVVSTTTIEEALYLKRVDQKWLFSLILGIISLAGSILMLFLSPSTLIETSGIITGITLIIASIEDVSIVISMYKIKKRLLPRIIDADVIDIK